MFLGVFEYSIVARAVKERKVKINLVNLRNFGEGPHKMVDDKPYGGGVGMILRVDILHKAIKATKMNKGVEKIVIMDARGEKYSQKHAESFLEIDHLIIICGRYEGFDERIKEYVDYSISIGDFVLTGGEIPAMTIVDSVTRLIPKVLSKSEATSYESFSLNENGRVLEHPQYTRPEVYDRKKVPEVLLSGHELKIKEFREREAIEITGRQRPELISPKSVK
jgi:tRNA (guanine37-N1)-methyltransferase